MDRAVRCEKHLALVQIGLARDIRDYNFVCLQEANNLLPLFPALVRGNRNVVKCSSLVYRNHGGSSPFLDWSATEAGRRVFAPEKPVSNLLNMCI